MKKWFFSITTVVMVLAVAQANALLIDPDVNNDSTVDWQDILRVVRAVAFEKDDPDSDVDGSGVIDNTDLVLVMVYAVAYLQPGEELLPQEALREFHFLMENGVLMGDINDNGVVALNDWEDFVMADLNVDIAVDIVDLLMMGRIMPGTEPNRVKVTPAIQRMDHTHDGWLGLPDLQMTGCLMKLMKLRTGDYNYQTVLPDEVEFPAPVAVAAAPLSPGAERKLKEILEPEPLTEEEEKEAREWLEDLTLAQPTGKLATKWGRMKIVP